MARNQRQQRLAVKCDVRANVEQLEHGGHQVLVQRGARDALTRGQLVGQTDDQRHVQCVFIHAVMVVPALVLVQGLAVVAVDDD